MRIFSATLAVIALTIGASAAAAQAPKNVLLVIADDLGLTLGCYGDKVAQTPNLDAFAKKATKFTRAYATVASCSPSRSAIFTGLHTHQNGMYGLHHAPHSAQSHPWVVSLPNLLRAAGYWTGIIGKVHVGPKAVYDWEYEPAKVNGRDPGALAKSVKEFLARREKRPFFLTVGLVDPHRAGVGFGNEAFAKRDDEIQIDPAKIVVPYHLPDNAAVRKDLAEYYQSVARMDRAFGKILQALQESGELENTLIIFISDNGIPFPGAKTTLYASGIHLPMLIACPGHKGGGENHGLVSFIDLAPTILDATGAKGPKYALTGKSLLPILDEAGPKGWDAVFGSHQRHEITMDYPMRSLTTPRYKLIVNLEHQKDFPFASDLWGSPSWQSVRAGKLDSLGQRPVAGFLRRPKEELFDLSTDPNELKNLASDPAFAATLGSLRQRLRQWQTATNDPWQILYREDDLKYNSK